MEQHVAETQLLTSSERGGAAHAGGVVDLEGGGRNRHRGEGWFAFIAVGPVAAAFFFEGDAAEGDVVGGVIGEFPLGNSVVPAGPLRMNCLAEVKVRVRVVRKKRESAGEGGEVGIWVVVLWGSSAERSEERSEGQWEE